MTSLAHGDDRRASLSGQNGEDEKFSVKICFSLKHLLLDRNSAELVDSSESFVSSERMHASEQKRTKVERVGSSLSFTTWPKDKLCRLLSCLWVHVRFSQWPRWDQQKGELEELELHCIRARANFRLPLIGSLILMPSPSSDSRRNPNPRQQRRAAVKWIEWIRIDYIETHNWALQSQQRDELKRHGRIRCTRLDFCCDCWWRNKSKMKSQKGLLNSIIAALALCSSSFHS